MVLTHRSLVSLGNFVPKFYPTIERSQVGIKMAETCMQFSDTFSGCWELPVTMVTVGYDSHVILHERQTPMQSSIQLSLPNNSVSYI